MLLAPKKTKFNKSFSGRKMTKTIKSKNSEFRFSTYCLIANQSGILTNFQVESIRRLLRRLLKKKAQLFFRLILNKPITKKPNEVRLGKGRGNVKYWAYFLKKGDIIWEIKFVNQTASNSIINSVRHKLPIKSFILNRQKRWIL
jgi:large subunit ribosomal protein L16